MPQLSIIVPVYNAEKYLVSCVDSILNQSYTDYALYLVNDGSEDRSGEICDEYAKKDSRIIVLHTKNQGVGQARNEALELVQTPFIAMIDSDDIVNREYIEVLMNGLIKSGSDYIMGEFKSFSNEGEINTNKPYNKDLFSFNTYNKDEAIRMLCNEYYPAFITPQKIYRTEVFKNVRYPRLTVNVDEWAIHHLLMNCDRIAICNAELYYYRLSPEGMTRNFSLKKISGVKALLDRINTFEKGGYKEYLPVLYERFFFKAKEFYIRASDNSLDSKRELHLLKKDIIKAYEIRIKGRKDLYSKKEQLAQWLFAHDLNLYELYCKTMKRYI